MDSMQRKKNAAAFAAEWSGRGYEKGDAQVFWTELLQQIVGMQNISRNVRVEYRTASGGFIDCLIPDAGVIVEQKGLGIDLDKPEERQGRMVTPFEQALTYAESFPRNRQPRFVVVCNFSTFRVHDRDACPRAELAGKYVEFTLEELGRNPHLLDFVTDPANSRSEREKQVSMEAGRLIGELHALLQAQYIDPESEESQKALNILCVRLVFCLFCEDAALFPKAALLNNLRTVEPKNMRVALKRLFKALATPIEKRDPYDKSVKPFPYVNGGLFAEESEIPNFADEIKFKLLFEVSQQTDWSQISPTIFGGIFESTLNPETRRSGGMHYTSPENIHKVIAPLFLDGLQEELDSIRSQEGVTPRKRKNALRRFRKKLSSLKFLDPACGSGNFLTETYLSLRRLEDDVLSELNDGQVEMVLGDETEEDTKRVTLSQFYGIEINDFAANVARTALWIAQLQANNETDMLLDISAEDFPLRDSANIVEANALRIDWDDVLPASECNYIMGNPPFVGSSLCSKVQKSEIVDLFGKKVKRSSSLDYVSGWFYKSAETMKSNPLISTALVSTNSITFGEQVYPIWQTLSERFNTTIDFAWKTFVWNNEATDQAHVHVVVIGFSSHQSNHKYIYDSSGVYHEAKSINPYLIDAPWILVSSRAKPLTYAPKMINGCKPTDGGNYIFKPEEMKEFLSLEPNAAKWFHPFLGSYELINGKERFCLYLGDASIAEIAKMPLVRERIEAVRKMRMASSAAPTRKAADNPQHFFFEAIPQQNYIAIPEVSSQRRKYIPAAFLSPKIMSSNKLLMIPEGNLYEFGILLSQFHNAWMRVITGRLKSDYQYSGAIVYNNFIWPGVTKDKLSVPVKDAVSVQIREKIEQCAQRVLDARTSITDASLADMYNPDNEWMFPDLAKAHRELDAAVEAAYGVDFQGDEEKIVAHLFKLYAELTNGD